MAWWVDKMSSSGRWFTGQARKFAEFFPGVVDGEEALDNSFGITANRQYEQNRQDQLHSYSNTLNSMIEAGLNPALLQSGSAGSIGATSATASSNNGGLGNLVSIFSALMQNRVADRQQKEVATNNMRNFWLNVRKTAAELAETKRHNEAMEKTQDKGATASMITAESNAARTGSDIKIQSEAHDQKVASDSYSNTMTISAGNGSSIASSFGIAKGVYNQAVSESHSENYSFSVPEAVLRKAQKGDEESINLLGQRWAAFRESLIKAAEAYVNKHDDNILHTYLKDTFPTYTYYKILNSSPDEIKKSFKR